MTAAAGPPTARRAGRFERAFNTFLVWLLGHWVALFTLGLAVFVALPVAAPVLAANGYERAATVIYVSYRVTCHQLPHHSWFLFGPKASYTWEEVQPYTGLDPDQALLAFHHPVRDPALGYQLAFCERDTAIWVSLLLTVLALGVARRRRPGAPLPLKLYALALVPIGVDGVTQLVGWRASTPLLRTVTGAIFGMATALLAVPHLDLAARDVRALALRAREADDRLG